MGSRVVACRLAEDLFEEFETLCNQEGLSPSEKLKKLVDNFVYPLQRVSAGVAQANESEPETIQARLASFRCPNCGGYLVPKYILDKNKEKYTLEMYAYACPVCLVSTGYFGIPKVDSAKDGKYGYYDPHGSFHEYDTSVMSKFGDEPYDDGLPF